MPVLSQLRTFTASNCNLPDFINMPTPNKLTVTKQSSQSMFCAEKIIEITTSFSVEIYYLAYGLLKFIILYFFYFTIDATTS